MANFEAFRRNISSSINLLFWKGELWDIKFVSVDPFVWVGTRNKNIIHCILSLGKVTEDQIRAGYRSLSKISELIDKNNFDLDELVEHCNAFYTRIPHYFGFQRPPKIDTKEDVQAKIELLEILTDISRGIKVMDIKKEEKSEEEDKIVEVPNPLDVQYKKLNVKLEPLDKTSDDFMLIEKYIQTTHGKTHTLWKMEVENIFVCEKDSLKFNDKLGNRY